ncbi:unnamed protein product [Effrenium voratum]|nr:unnamed protein product [Effrenium voratum]
MAFLAKLCGVALLRQLLAASVEEVGLAVDDDCRDSQTCALNALQLSRKRCDFDFEAEVQQPMVKMTDEIEALNNRLVVLVAKALRTSFKDDFSKLVGATSEAVGVIERITPKFMLLVNKTSAVLKDPSIKNFGSAAEKEQNALLTMQGFAIGHAGEVMTNIANMRELHQENSSFATDVNEVAQLAREWLQGVLKTSWSGATEQLPRINALVKDEYTNTSQMVTEAACAANTASSIAQLTSLYADIVSAGADCNATNKTMFNLEDCESSALTVQSGIAQVISASAKMMSNCYQSSWVCADESSAAGYKLLKAYISTIVVKDSCRSSDPIALAVCESESFKLVSTLGVAAGHMRKATRQCGSSCGSKAPL